MNGNGDETTKKLKRWALWMTVILGTGAAGAMLRPWAEAAMTVDTRAEMATVQDSVVTLARIHDRDIQALDKRITEAIADNNEELVKLMVQAMREDRKR